MNIEFSLFFFAALVIGLMLLNYYLKGLEQTKKSIVPLFSPIDSQLAAGRNLILREIELFKRHAPNENAETDKVIRLIQAAGSAGTIDEKMNANNYLNYAIIQFHQHTDRYPALLNEPEYQQLQDQLQKVDQAIIPLRRVFNNKVKEYNEILERFPTNVFGKLAGMKKQGYFEPDAAPEPVKIMHYGKKSGPAPLRVFLDDPK